jgi:hypothetical protein
MFYLRIVDLRLSHFWFWLLLFVFPLAFAFSIAWTPFRLKWCPS